MKEEAKISVIMPVYNAEPYLKETLESLSAQTYRNVEYFFVDDGSTDRSVEILRQYTESHPEAHLLQQEHQFAGAARNYGMQYAQGDYLLFLDADDLFYADMIESAVARAEETNADICVFKCEQFDNLTGLKRKMNRVCDLKLCPANMETFSRHTNARNIFMFTLAVPWNKLFRRSFVEANDLTFQRTQSANDVAFVMTALAAAERIAVCDKVLLAYRANNTASLQGSKHTNPTSFFEARRELRKRLIERNIFDEVEAAYVNYALAGCIHNLKVMPTQESFEEIFNLLKNGGLSELDLLLWPKEYFYQSPRERLFENREAIMELTAEEFEKRYRLLAYHVPAVSVVIPVYNVELYLRECLDSVLDQTLQDIEIICVDDVSTDGSPDILREYAAKDERVHVIWMEENRGAGAARNIGFAQATGLYTIFLDSDDVFDPALLRKTFNKAEDTDAQIIAFNFSRFDDEGNITHSKGIHDEWLPAGTTVFNYQDCPDLIMNIISPTPWNKLYLSEYIRERGLRFEEISSTNDITFAAVSAASAERISFLKDELVHYRIGHGGTITSTKSKKLNNVRIAILSAVEQARKLPYFEQIRKSAMRFAVNSSQFALRNYANIDDEAAKEYYDFLHTYYNEPFFDECSAETLRSDRLFAIFRSIRDTEYPEYRRRSKMKVTASLTSFPEKIAGVHQVVENLLSQTKRPDRVILWLADSQFPDRVLPEELRRAEENGNLCIRWCDDLRPHKKYFYALQEQQDDELVITVDDDIVYPPNLIESLHLSYLCFPDAVSAARVHLMVADENRKLLPYEFWPKNTTALSGEASMQLFATSGAGGLYPPNIFPRELFDRDAIIETCLDADDLWLKAMELAANVPVAAMFNYKLQYLPGSQTQTLFSSNKVGGNDDQLQAIMEWFDNKYGEGFFISRLLDSEKGVPQCGIREVMKHVKAVDNNRRAVIDAQKKTINSKNKALKSRKDELAKQDAEIKKKDAELKKRRARIRRRDAEIANITAELENKNAEIKKKNEELKKRRARIRRRDTEIANKTAELESKDAEIKKKNEELKKRRARIRRRDAEIAGKTAELESKEAEIKRNAAKLALLTAELEKKDAELAAKTAELKKKTAALNKTRQRVDSITASASYRIGRTITWIPRRLKGGVSRVRE